MKKNIHPVYYDNAKVICACGNTFTVGSTKELIHVELCNKCHPFYTGKQKFVDAVGRIEKFQKKVSRAASLPKKIKKGEKKEDNSPKTLKEMLMGN